MAVKAIIFDLDGVLCSTDEYHYRAWKSLAERLNIDFDRADNDRLRGISRMDSLELVLEKSSVPYSDAEKLALAEEKNERYRAMLTQMSPNDLSAEVRNTLDELRRRGYRLAVGSSSQNAKLILGRIGLGTFFDAISDGTNITRSKPDPEVFLCAASFLDVRPEDCAVVEDAWAGIDAAKAGGMLAVAVGDAVRSPGADIRLEQFQDMLDVFGISEKT